MSDNIANFRLNGLNPLGYMGVNPTTPVPFFIKNRAPTTTDSQNFIIGTIWLYVNNVVSPNTYQVWMLVSLTGGIATWIQIDAAADAIKTLTGNTGGAVGPDGSANIDVVGDAVGITIAGNPATHTLTASLVGGGIAAQSFPTDSGTATPNSSGVLNVKTQNATQGCGASVLFSAPGVSNTIQLDVTDANNNTTIGLDAGGATLVNTSSNTAVGRNALNSVTTGADSNTAIGFNALLGVATGNFNVAIGSSAGVNYATSESNNILIGNQGTLGDNNTIRIGDSQTTAYMSGINGNTVSSPIFVTVDTATNQLGTSTAGVITNGLFTPNIALGGATTGITYSVQQGEWTHFTSGNGVNFVQLNLTITLSSKGTATGDLTITDLPFSFQDFPAANCSTAFFPLSNINLTAGYDIAWIQASHGTTNALVYQGSYTGSSFTPITDSNLSNTSGFGLSISYRTDD